MRLKFRQHATTTPDVLLNQFVCLNLGGPSYRVLEIIQNNGKAYAARLEGYKSGCYIYDNPELGHYKSGYCALGHINYYAGDLINLHQSRIDNITKNIKD